MTRVSATSSLLWVRGAKVPSGRTSTSIEGKAFMLGVIDSCILLLGGYGSNFIVNYVWRLMMGDLLAHVGRTNGNLPQSRGADQYRKCFITYRNSRIL